MTDGLIIGKVTATGLYKFVRVPDDYVKGEIVAIIKKEFLDKVYKEGLILEKNAYEKMCELFEKPQDKEIKPSKKSNDKIEVKP